MIGDFKIKVIATGSKGNCYLISVGDESLLLECGITWKEILKGVDFNIRDIKGCLISHSHKDHCKAFGDVVYSGIQIYCNTDTLYNCSPKFNHNVHVFPNGKFNVGEFTILTFPCNHNNNDGSECECTGFLIKHPTAGKLLFATDTYYLKYKFKDIDHVLIECNYTEKILEEMQIYNSRVLKSHMSLETLKESLKTWDLDKIKNIILIHMSDKHGDKELFKREIEEITGKKVYVAEKGLEIK